MKTLSLLRHAHTLADPPPGLGDHGRVLSERGLAEARRVGSFMLQAGFLPDMVLSSPAARALETARIVISAVSGKEGCPIGSHSDPRLYLASPHTLAEAVSAAADSCSHLLLVGHNPGIAELAMRLGAGETSGYPPGFLAVFEGDLRAWADFRADGMRPREFFTP